MSHDNLVGIYWDFDNIHLGALDLMKPPSEVEKIRKHGPHPVVVDFDAIIDYASSYGRVVVNKAYGNWLRFPRYERAVQEKTIELFQMFSGARGKNGADIKMSLDVMLDLHHLNLTHVLVVTGDSDFVPLAQSVRKTGTKIVGLGTKNRVSKYLVAICDEFVYYDNLVDVPTRSDHSDFQEARQEGIDLLTKCVKTAAGDTSDGWAETGEVWDLMRRIDPGFSLSELRVGQLVDLARLTDKIECKVSNGVASFRLTKAAALKDALDGTYFRPLKKMGYFFSPIEYTMDNYYKIFDFFKEKEVWDRYEFLAKIGETLELEPARAKKYLQAFRKSYVLWASDEGEVRGFADPEENLVEILGGVYSSILTSTGEIDEARLTLTLWGEKAPEDWAETLEKIKVQAEEITKDREARALANAREQED